MITAMPDVPRRVVVNTTPIIALSLLGRIDLLRHLYVDERLARRHAQRLGLSLTGTLGILLRAKQQGLVLSVQTMINELQRGGIWLSNYVIEETLRLANEE